MFTLRARADRIERLADGSYAILDYKTGQVPTDKQVRIGLSPQLTLEAAILRGGGFPGHSAPARVAELVYVSLKGREPAGEDKAIDFKDGDADPHAERALAKLTAVRASRTSSSPIARWCCRCGRAATAPTTTSRA